MSQIFWPTEIPFNTSVASQRVVYASFFSDSQTTRPVTTMAGIVPRILVGPNYISVSSSWQIVGGSGLSGVYRLVLAQSECSAQGGPGYVVLHTSVNSVGNCYHPVYFPRVDSYDTMRMGLFSQPNAAAEAAGGLPTLGTGTGQINLSGGSVGIVPGTLSGVSVQGLSNYANISNVTLAAGTHSGVTIQGVTRLNSNVTLNANTHSGATIDWVNFVASTSTVSSMALVAGQQVADRVLLRALASGSDTGRTVQDALRPLRNKVAIGGSTLTVYQEDDTTSAWTGSITTGPSNAGPLTAIDPL